MDRYSEPLHVRNPYSYSSISDVRVSVPLQTTGSGSGSQPTQTSPPCNFDNVCEPWLDILESCSSSYPNLNEPQSYFTCLCVPQFQTALGSCLECASQLQESTTLLDLLSESSVCAPYWTTTSPTFVPSASARPVVVSTTSTSKGERLSSSPRMLIFTSLLVLIVYDLCG